MKGNEDSAKRTQQFEALPPQFIHCVENFSTVASAQHSRNGVACKRSSPRSECSGRWDGPRWFSCELCIGQRCSAKIFLRHRAI